jgi:hypothetical protein
MSEYNLATVFAPTLIGSGGTNIQNLTDMSQEIHILTVLITNYCEIFQFEAVGNVRELRN